MHPFQRAKIKRTLVMNSGDESSIGTLGPEDRFVVLAPIARGNIDSPDQVTARINEQARRMSRKQYESERTMVTNAAFIGSI